MPLICRVLDRQRVGSLREYVELGGGSAAHAARVASPHAIIELLSAAGLRGRGGAGFPTGTKWETVAASRSNRDVTTVVVNAAEGEPGTFKDRALLRTNPYRVLEGAIIAATAMQSDQIRIGIKGTFGREIDRLTTAIAELRAASWLDDHDVQLVLGPSSYLFGEETALLEVLEGRQPFPRVTPPYRRGLQDDDTRSAGGVSLATTGGDEAPPALVDNVETLANVPLIVDMGADWFRELGTARSPGTIVCTVSGATRRSAVGELPMGSTLREAIDLVGWGPRRGHEIQFVLAGTANALVPSRLLDTPLTYEAMQEVGTGLGSAGFIVFDETTDPLAIAAGVARFLSVESCGQCEHCKSDGMDIAARLGGSSLDVEALRRRIDTVAIGARCNLAQQQAAVAASLLDLVPQPLRRSHGATHPAIDPVAIAPIEDLVGGRATLDTSQLTKQPDWSYGARDSGATPAARLGNTPVRIGRQTRPRPALDWTPSETIEDPLELVHDAHAAIDALVDRALSARDEDLASRVADLVVAVCTHVDVTRRVLFPMVRRVGDDEGEDLADAAEAQERTLLHLVAEVDHAHEPRHTLHDIGVAMHEHAALGDQILAVLRAELDPIERSSLADGLAAARSTSTVNRLYRTARIHRIDPRPTPRPRDRGERAVDRPASRGTADALRRMLVGIDGSPAATSALEWAGHLAARTGAEVLVANVFEPAQAEVSPDDYDKLLEEAEQRLAEEWAAPLRASTVRHRCLQLTGSPDRLLVAAEAERADLLVVGTRGTGRHAALHLGSLAHHLAHRTRGPLAIVPAAGAAANLERIVVGVDGSPGSEAAVGWCADIAAALGANVVAVHADKHPLAALDGAAKQQGAGLFVVGVRGLRDGSGLRVGRLPLQLVHHTHLPVVLVPPARHR